MINEKYIPPLATITMIALVLFVAFGSYFNLKAGDNKVLQEPEYMSKLFDKDKLLEINITIEDANWEDLKANAQQENYYPANITINGETFYNVGFRAKGNSSLSMVASDDTTDRYSFKIKVDEYQDQSIYGLKKFVLNNNIGDATSMKEYLSYDMLSHLGVVTPGYAYAHITLNGEEWGTYLAVEALEEEFVQRNFGSLDGNLYKVETSSMGGQDKNGQDQVGKGERPQMPEGIDGANMPQMPEGTDGANMPQMPEGTGGANMPQMPEGTDGANMPQMPEGTDGTNMPQIPEGMDAANRPQVPEGTDGANMPQMPEGMDGANMPQMPEGMDAANRPQIPEGMDMSNKPGGGGGMGGGGTSGANLIYTDDEISSYSDIFNYTILKKTTTKDYKTMIEILKQLNTGENLEACIDIENVLKYFAVNTFVVNLDSYASNMKHNFYLYEEAGKLSIVPWDFNLAFGGFMVNSASRAINFPIDAPVTDSMENSPLIAKLLEVDAYKEMYHSYLQELVETYITSGKYEETIGNVDTLINNSIQIDATAFYTYEEYKAALPELIQFGKDRATSIMAQLKGEQPSDSYGNIESTVNLTAMGQQGGGGNKGDGKGQMGNQMNNQMNNKTGNKEEKINK